MAIKTIEHFNTWIDEGKSSDKMKKNCSSYSFDPKLISFPREPNKFHRENENATKGINIGVFIQSTCVGYAVFYNKDRFEMFKIGRTNHNASDKNKKHSLLENKGKYD